MSFSPFDNKCVKPNAKKPLEIYLGHLEECVLHISPKVKLSHGWCPPIPFRIFVDHVTIFSSSLMQHLR